MLRSVTVRLVTLVTPAALSLASFIVLGAVLGCSGDSAPAPASGAPGASTSAPGGQGSTKGTPKDTEADPEESGSSGSSNDVTYDCTGEAGTFYALTVKKLGGGADLPLCAFKDKVVLVVNGASSCGYTPQYKPLEALYAKYKDTQAQPFEILAFPSDSFNQEKDTDKEVSEFCTTEYHITFPLTTIGPVVDDASKNITAQPVYQWLYQQPGYSTPVAWNFEKFLISKEGKLVKRWLSAVSPDEGGDIDKTIAAELAK